MVVNTCPISLNGGSTGFAPIHVSRVAVTRNTQNINFFTGLNLLFLDDFFNVRTPMITMAATIASTPPSFDGIDRKIAYANKKYHSG